jgi:hypothetical protein
MSALIKERDIHGRAIVNSSIRVLRAFLIEERSARVEYKRQETDLYVILSAKDKAFPSSSAM